MPLRLPSLAAPLLALLLAGPALAQPAQAQPGQSQPAPAEDDGPVPPEPALSAPQPPDLTRPPEPGRTVPQPALPLARGMEALPGGGWRLTGPLARGRVDAPSQIALAGIARWLAQQTQGRVTLIAQVAGPEEDVSLARRDSLDHGRAIRRALEQAGLDVTRIDIRPLGRTEERRDAIELLPPSARQKQSQSRP
ncbi:hypothetical protein NON00_00350 [Roseomonas sp. GC11]|uniref:hypothetical protein n=1 Tax=Roseomonas sp. GC11 TaxID=2950546 RepID=UPI00210E4596|nr:hypothetical protein [Roseomonas sp. GC11]MCQ4158376.1 hypothetical protein [Roseomonas sp. GC11]